VITQGPTVNVPAESSLTFSLQQPLTLGVADTGYTRDGVHYHRISPADRAGTFSTPLAVPPTIKTLPLGKQRR